MDRVSVLQEENSSGDGLIGMVAQDYRCGLIPLRCPLKLLRCKFHVMHILPPQLQIKYKCSSTANRNFLGVTSIQRTFSHSLTKHVSQGDEKKALATVGNASVCPCLGEDWEGRDCGVNVGC